MSIGGVYWSVNQPVQPNVAWRHTSAAANTRVLDMNTSWLSKRRRQQVDGSEAAGRV
jgi:hypothetical protein